MWARSELCLRYIEDMRKRESPPHRVQRGFPYITTIASYTIPCAIMALATFMNPATLAPFT